MKTDLPARSFKGFLRCLPVVLLGAAAVVGVILNLQEAHQAGEKSRQLLQAQSAAVQEASYPQTILEEESGSEVPDVEESQLTDPEDVLADLTANYDVDGVLSIPALGLELPVLAEYEENNLRMAPCLFAGFGGDQPDHMVVVAHNYKEHFGHIDRLVAEDEVSYCSSGGVCNSYQVTEVVEIDAQDAQALMEGKWDITLLTCNFDNSKRILVRCVKS